MPIMNTALTILTDIREQNHIDISGSGDRIFIQFDKRHHWLMLSWYNTQTSFLQVFTTDNRDMWQADSHIYSRALLINEFQGKKRKIPTVFTSAWIIVLQLNLSKNETPDDLLMKLDVGPFLSVSLEFWREFDSLHTHKKKRESCMEEP